MSLTTEQHTQRVQTQIIVYPSLVGPIGWLRIDENRWVFVYLAELDEESLAYILKNASDPTQMLPQYLALEAFLSSPSKDDDDDAARVGASLPRPRPTRPGLERATPPLPTECHIG